MPEYIEREALIKEIEADFNTDWTDYASKNNFDKDYIDGVRDEYDDTLKIICQQKTADVQPVKHGKWEQGKCTNCEKSLEDLFEGDFYYDCDELHFCPNCGARMMKDGDAE